MQVISKANKSILRILSKFYREESIYRLSRYCIQSEIGNDILLFNLLTRELLLLSNKEFQDICKNEYFKKQWFLVPENFNEKELASLCKTFLLSQRQKFSPITGYTIFPTTDCNARCFYCFEKGRPVSTMSTDTAHKIVKYIKNHCGGKRVTFRWFGGEPLMNPDAIDIICSGLREAGVEYISTMVSNGYLFTDELVLKAKNLWNLHAIQITLDGTEKVYNRVKAYVNSTENAYNVVLSNIERLTNASIKVMVRMNMDLYNADDLLALSKYLVKRFKGNKYLSAYPHHIFQDGIPMGEMHTPEEWKKRDLAISKIEKVFIDAGMFKIKSLSTKPRFTQCMADSGSAVTIVPDGHIGLCEHYSESEFIGHIDSDEFDKSVISSWRETVPEIPECNDCFYYPECIMLKKCTNSTVCYPQLRVSHLRRTKARMLQLYNKWLENNHE